MQSKGISIKQDYIRAHALLATNNPKNSILGAHLLHKILYEIKCETEEQAFFKGKAAVDLGRIFLIGVDSGPLYKKDGDIYCIYYIESDWLKAYELLRRAMLYDNYEGVELIGEIYLMLGQYQKAAETFQAVVQHGLFGTQSAKAGLKNLLAEGKIKKVPQFVPHPTYSPSFSFTKPLTR